MTRPALNQECLGHANALLRDRSDALRRLTLMRIRVELELLILDLEATMRPTTRTLCHVTGDTPARLVELRVSVTEPMPATRWDPADPGEIRPLALFINGKQESIRDHAELVEEVLAMEEVA